jgi:hypothetical protein
VTERLLALAVALLARLGFLFLPLADAGPVLPVVVPLMAGGAAWLPLRPLGLPDEHAPMTGDEP